MPKVAILKKDGVPIGRATTPRSVRVRWIVQLEMAEANAYEGDTLFFAETANKGRKFALFVR